MMNIRNSVLAVMIAGAGFVGMAQAGTLSGSAATASADVVFTNPVELTNTLTPIAGLSSSASYASSKTIGQGSLTVSDGSQQQIAIRIVSGEVHPNFTNGARVISGNNNSENKLGVNVVMNASGVPRVETIDGNVFEIGDSGVTEYTVVTYGQAFINGSVVNPDTYTIQTEAYIYNA